MKLRNELSAAEFGEIYSCSDCGSHPVEDIEEVIASYMSVGWGPEHSTYAILKRRDGLFYALEEGEDTTGHGCRCNFFLSQGFETAEEAFRLGLGDWARKELMIPEK